MLSFSLGSTHSERAAKHLQKVVRPMETIFILESILLTLVSQIHVTATEPCISYEAERKHGKALVGHVIKTVSLEQFECMSACNRVLKCFSTNLYHTNNGSAACEMNKSTRELSPASFIYKSGYEYNQITRMKMCSVDGRKNKDGKSSGPVAHYRLDGNDPGVTLRGDALYQTDGSGDKVLYLDGTRSYAETPATDFTTTSFTIACWVKILSPGVNNVDIYGDWSSPYQFRLTYNANNRRVSLQARNTNGQDQLLVGLSPIPFEQWVHVAVNWNRETLDTSMFWNGRRAASANAVHSGVIDLMKTNHAVYDIGLKRDSGSAQTFKGFIKELMIFDRALKEEEVEGIKDMPPQMIPRKLKFFNDEKSSND